MTFDKDRVSFYIQHMDIPALFSCYREVTRTGDIKIAECIGNELGSIFIENYLRYLACLDKEIKHTDKYADEISEIKKNTNIVFCLFSGFDGNQHVPSKREEKLQRVHQETLKGLNLYSRLLEEIQFKVDLEIFENILPSHWIDVSPASLVIARSFLLKISERSDLYLKNRDSFVNFTEIASTYKFNFKLEWVNYFYDGLKGELDLDIAAGSLCWGISCIMWNSRRDHEICLDFIKDLQFKYLMSIGKNTIMVQKEITINFENDTPYKTIIYNYCFIFFNYIYFRISRKHEVYFYTDNEVIVSTSLFIELLLESPTREQANRIMDLYSLPSTSTRNL